MWSFKPTEATDNPTTLWYVPRDTPDITVIGGFDGLGLRGNDSCPVIAENARIPFTNRLGEDGQGAELSSTAILPWFLTLNASNGVGLMQAVSAAALKRLNGTRLEWVKAQELQHRMDDGRRRHLSIIGFPDDEAAELSALHTRNFM